AILEHNDGDLAAEFGIARIHVPIATNSEVEFLLNGTQVSMVAGEAWYLRLADRHSAVNRGSEDRVHLVIDAEVNGWLGAQLESGAASA
ncbi:MAG: aspartyl beta-hydroxylase, partial [Sphingomonadales bacterium]